MSGFMPTKEGTAKKPSLLCTSFFYSGRYARMNLPLIAQTPITVQQKVYTSNNSEKREISKFGLAVYLTSAANMLLLLFYRFIRRIQNSPDEKIFKLFQKICTNMLKFSNVCDNIWCKS